MKRLVISVAFLSLVGSAHAANPFHCTGYDADGGRVLTLAANGQSQTQIRDLRLNWESSWPVKIALPIVEKTEKYNPRNPRYRGLEKWSVNVPNGPACKWDLLLPPAATRPASFGGYSQTACDSYYETISLKCTTHTRD